MGILLKVLQDVLLSIVSVHIVTVTTSVRWTYL